MIKSNLRYVTAGVYAAESHVSCQRSVDDLSFPSPRHLVAKCSFVCVSVFLLTPVSLDLHIAEWRVSLRSHFNHLCWTGRNQRSGIENSPLLLELNAAVITVTVCNQIPILSWSFVFGLMNHCDKDTCYARDTFCYTVFSLTWGRKFLNYSCLDLLILPIGLSKLQICVLRMTSV